MNCGYSRESLWILFRGFLLLLGLLLPLNMPFSIPPLESEKRFGWSVAVTRTEAGEYQPRLIQVLRHGYTHGVLSGDILLELDGLRADSAMITAVRTAAEVGDTVHLSVDRQGQQLMLAVPVASSSASYANYFWYRMSVAIAAWAIGMALIAWRGQRSAPVVLGAALMLLAPITASAGVPGDGLLLSIARWGWQVQAAAFSLFMPVLLLHFIRLQHPFRRSPVFRLWGPVYLVLILLLALSTDYFRDPMAWAGFGPIREFRSAVGLILNAVVAAVAALMLHRPVERGPDSGRWVTFAILLVTGTNAILSGARFILGDPNVGELFWRLNGSTLLLLLITAALYLVLPRTSLRPQFPAQRRLAAMISFLLTGLYGFSVVGVAAVLLSVSGIQSSGEEWLLFLGIFLGTVIFSPVLRWSDEVAGRHIFSQWRELEKKCQEFVERIGLELTPEAIARTIAEEMPSLLDVPSVSLITASRALEGGEIAESDDNITLIPIHYPGGTTLGQLHLSAPIRRDSPEFACLGILTNGIVLALRNAESYHRLRDTELELAESKRIASLGALASGLAHEIKNPLAGLKIGLYLLEHEGVNNQKLLRLHRDLSRIDDLVVGLLRFTHNGGGEEPTPLSLRAIVDDCMTNILPLAEDCEVLFQRADPKEDVRVLAAPGPLRLLISNILHNALDAAGPGGVIRVETTLRGVNVELAIHDSGPGIPAGLEEQIFELSFSTKPDGTGLGLALARREAERLGGRIEVESAVDNGTLLRVVLPRLI